MEPLGAPHDVAAAKAALRAEIRARRRAQDPRLRARRSAAACRHLRAWIDPLLAGAGSPTVAAFLAMPHEPDPSVLCRSLHEDGVRVLVPVIEPGRRLSWARWSPEVPLARARLAPVDEPVGPRWDGTVLEQASALVLPGLAASADGYRLGQGGGYYDRVLAALDARLPRVVQLFAQELLPAGAVPREATDAPVHAVATEDGVTVCPAHPRSGPTTPG